ncbi:MAG: ECF transporter S component [Oscillospiraceae bacterium]|nr:ECF transporter S component [Oscillospiraceae bacterium]
MTKYRQNLINLTLSAMFLAIGLVLPFLTGQIPQIGSMLLPMHIPVLLCGLICGWQYGLTVGFITPLLRSLLFGMPVLYPGAIAMAFELATYGAVIGFLYNHSKWKCIISLYRSMIAAMIAGRLVWGVAEIILLGIKGNTFTWTAFISGAFLNAIPGIIIQLILIPAIMVALNKTGLVKFTKKANKTQPAD